MQASRGQAPHGAFVRHLDRSTVKPLGAGDANRAGHRRQHPLVRAFGDLGAVGHEALLARRGELTQFVRGRNARCTMRSARCKSLRRKA